MISGFFKALSIGLFFILFFTIIIGFFIKEGYIKETIFHDGFYSLKKNIDNIDKNSSKKNTNKIKKGIDQTKAIKSLIEISQIVQSAIFYKTLNERMDYFGISNNVLNQAGILEGFSLVPISNLNLENLLFNSTEFVSPDDILISSSNIDGLYFLIKENKRNKNTFIIETVIDISKIEPHSEFTESLEKNIKSLKNKGVYNLIDGDGAIDIYF